MNFNECLYFLEDCQLFDAALHSNGAAQAWWATTCDKSCTPSTHHGNAATEMMYEEVSCRLVATS
eukprot:SAG31_NODE_3370_length_4353_cov_5.039962_4_plen_65_part_00